MSSIVDASEALPRLSLVGGPFHRVGRRLGLVRGESNTLPLGLAVGATLWIVQVVLMLVDGLGGEVFTLAFIGSHIRLLVALPMFYLCESLLDPRLATFVTTIVRSGIVPPASLPRLDEEIRRVRRWCDSWVLDLVCLAVAGAALLFGSQLSLPGATGAIDPEHAAAGLSLSAAWYWGVCLTVFRFALVRWLARLLIWAYFLVRLAGLGLRLSPSHPDRAGGLGYLEVVHMHFVPLIFAFSAVEAASFAEGIAARTMAFEATYPIFALALGVDALLFIGPLLIVTPLLWACRVRGLSEFNVFAAGYVTGFDRKWVKPGVTPDEPLLGTPDLQSLADLGNSANVVRDMRVLPASLTLVRDYAIAALLPMIPLLLLEYPIAELAQRFVSRLSGL